MSTAVLYHASCADGFGAAWAAWKAGAGAPGDAPAHGGRYLPVTYGPPPPPLEPGERVFILDFSYPREVLLDLASRHELRVIDHHKTAAADLEGLPFCTFDMNRSGAVLAWKFFHPTSPLPRLLEYVEDRDLWSFDLNWSRAISAWIASHPMDFETWDKLATQLEDTLGFDTAASEGSAILRLKAETVSLMCNSARLGEVGGHQVPIVNAACFQSEVGEELCRRFPKAPFSASYFDRGTGVRQWGLRSRGDFDVSVVAKMYGGGGHAAAAGFQTAFVAEAPHPMIASEQPQRCQRIAVCGGWVGHPGPCQPMN